MRAEQPGPHQGQCGPAFEPLPVLAVGGGDQLVQALPPGQEPLGLAAPASWQDRTRRAGLPGQEVGQVRLCGPAEGDVHVPDRAWLIVTGRPWLVVTCSTRTSGSASSSVPSTVQRAGASWCSPG